MSLPYPCIIKLKNGKKQMGIICSQNDSRIFLKTIFSGSNFINDTLKWKEIKSDTSLSRKEKLLHYMCVSYPDSVNYSYDSIKKIHFDLIYTKKGVLRTVEGLTVLTIGFFICYAYSFDDVLDLPRIVGPVAFMTGYYIFRETTNKNIRTKKWNLKKATDEYDVINLN